MTFSEMAAISDEMHREEAERPRLNRLVHAARRQAVRAMV